MDSALVWQAGKGQFLLNKRFLRAFWVGLAGQREKTSININTAISLDAALAVTEAGVPVAYRDGPSLTHSKLVAHSTTRQSHSTNYTNWKGLIQ